MSQNLIHPMYDTDIMHNMNRKLFLISGPPGSGKSTLARAIAQHFKKSIHIECDSLYNMVQGGHKKPWEDGADVLFSLMYNALISQAVIYLQAGFVIVSDYVWSPKELLFLFNQIGPGNLFYPVFLLPKKIINLERDLNREYSVGSERVAESWEDFEKWKPICPEIFFDNSSISVNEMSKNIIEGKGFCHSEIEAILSG